MKKILCCNCDTDLSNKSKDQYIIDFNVYDIYDGFENSFNASALCNKCVNKLGFLFYCHHCNRRLYYNKIVVHDNHIYCNDCIFSEKKSNFRNYSNKININILDDDIVKIKHIIRKSLRKRNKHSLKYKYNISFIEDLPFDIVTSDPVLYINLLNDSEYYNIYLAQLLSNERHPFMIKYDKQILVNSKIKKRTINKILNISVKCVE